MTAGKHTWVREDFLIALDVYMALRKDGIKLSTRSLDAVPYVHRALELINSLQIHLGKPKAPINSLKMYIQAFATFDGTYHSDGPQTREKYLRDLWETYAANTDALKTEVEAIRRMDAQLESGFQDAQVEDEVHLGALEGRVKYLYHLRIEKSRSQKLVQDKKKQFQKAHNRLICELCGFDFVQVYGELGEGFIECHHQKPISQLDGTEVTQLADLVLLCANCHRMAHRNGLLSIKELQAVLRWRFNGMITP